jgi:hypothetical protein
MGKRSVFQGFRLEIDKVLDIAELRHSGVESRQDIANTLGMGRRKVRSLSDWGCMVSILEGRGARSVTGLYLHIRRLNETGEWLKALQVIYYWLCRNNIIIEYLVNRYAEAGEFEKNRLIEELMESDWLSGKRTSIGGAVNTTLNSLVKTEGLKDLGVIRRSEREPESYSLHSQCPDRLVAGYIIYTNWPPNTAKVAISQIASGHNSLGRIFFLTEFEVMSILRELEDRNLIKIETAAGLNQIGRDSHIAPEDILEMMSAEG